MDIESSYNFRRISEKLTTSGVVRAEGLRSLSSQGYQVVVNLLPDTSGYAIPSERQIVQSQGIEYIYLPVDFSRPTKADFYAFAEQLDRIDGRKIHVHCAANYRVSAFYALYELRCGRWSVDQTLEFIHSIWRPADHPGWGELVAEIIQQLQRPPGEASEG